MKFAHTTALLAGLALTGCATAPPNREIGIQTPYDAAQAVLLLQPGTNSIKGSALLRQQGGGVVTCAGRRVFLIPTTGYARERVGKLYGGNATKMYLPAQRSANFTPNPPDYQKNVKEATCDAQGFFTFERVGDGSFYVNTSVNWTVNNVEQGGFLIELVTIKNSELQTVVLTR